MEQNRKDSYILLHINRMPVPVCMVDKDGIVVLYNRKMVDVFAYEDIKGSNFFALSGVKRETLEKMAVASDSAGVLREDSKIASNISNQTPVIIKRNDKYFELLVLSNERIEDDLIIFFRDVTTREKIRVKYEQEQLCTIYIEIDNYDLLINSNTDDSRMAVPTEVDRLVKKWAEAYNATLEPVEDEKYLLNLYRRDANKVIESKFSILDDVRKIDTKTDFPVSLSIGLGMGGETLKETQEFAEAALELAKGRGGDQAVLRKEDRTYYYGGKLQSMEKNNKGKSRVIAHALKQLANDSDRIFIMGHRRPDMDSFGASLGMYKACTYLGKRDTYIVLEEYNEALQTVYEQAKDTGNYTIIGREKAVNLCKSNSLVIVVDTHKISLVECPELLELADKVVIVDHHRLGDDTIENATLSYIESSASSASELTTEIIQYTANKRIINKFESEALLAGIMVDTNSFSSKTGVRTFEAAAWLRRSGADTTEVKRFFQSDVDTVRKRAAAIASAEYLDNGIAIAVSEEAFSEAQLVCAQVADRLLEIRGVKASFAFGRNIEGHTVISARSLGEINVQVILEQFGGGGHLSSAGAQLDVDLWEAVNKVKDVLLEDKKIESIKKEDREGE